MKQSYQSDHNASPDKFDRQLDSALANYAAVEPRVGLEERILTNLRAESNQRPSHAWWRWGVAGAVAVIAIAVGLEWRSSGTAHPVIANRPTLIQNSSDHGAKTVALSGGQIRADKRLPIQRTAVRRTQVTTASAPRLDQFPSPQPLSAQELALARYVSQFPQEATLIAQAQEEFQKEIQQRINEVHSDTEGNGSDQQER